MIDPTEATKIASRLTRGQQSTIRHMDDYFAVLSCAEATARRLCHATTTRPALVEQGQATDDYFPAGTPAFKLTDAGMAVRTAMGEVA